MKKYVVLEKAVGQTPLQCAEIWRRSESPIYDNSPLAYAGRLDPMASGKLLVLIGDECKVQEKYHNLDKEYEFSVLFGVGSDTADVLGLLNFSHRPEITESKIKKILQTMIGPITLPYPHFSSKTVQGKPLHVWTLEGRLDEITIPTKQSEIYQLGLVSLETKTRLQIYNEVSAKIETITPVTDPSKSLGNDFRRSDVRLAWQEFLNQGQTSDEFSIATLRCKASSGTYMRTLAQVIASKMDCSGLAYHIHRNVIGKYQKIPLFKGFWRKIYR